MVLGVRDEQLDPCRTELRDWQEYVRGPTFMYFEGQKPGCLLEGRHRTRDTSQTQLHEENIQREVEPNEDDKDQFLVVMIDKDHKRMYTRRYVKAEDISLNKNILDPNDNSNDRTYYNSSVIKRSEDHGSFKVWSLDHVFEEHIDRQEPTEDPLSISTKAQIAVGTRSIKGIWNFMTGKLQLKLANTALGALNTQALVNNEGPPEAVSGSGEFLNWNILNDRQANVQQLSRPRQGGEARWRFEHEFTMFINVLLSTIWVVLQPVSLPDNSSLVAMLDVDKRSLICIPTQNFTNTIQSLDGNCSKDDRWYLYAPAAGGMEMLDLRTGKANSDVTVVFNKTD